MYSYLKLVSFNFLLAETASLVTIKNTIHSFENMNILQRDAEKHDGKRKGMFISSEFINKEALHSFLHDINLCR